MMRAVPLLLLLAGCTVDEQFYSTWSVGAALFVGLLWHGIATRPREPRKALQMVRVAKVGEANGQSLYAREAPNGAWLPINANVTEVRTLADARRVRDMAKEHGFAAYELVGEVGRDVLDLLDPEYVEG